MKVNTFLYMFICVQTGLIAFKVMNVIKWSWLLIFIPSWIFILFSLIGIVIAIRYITKKDNSEWYEE